MDVHAKRLAALTLDLEPFRRFARSRLGTEDLADDALQDALLRATQHVGGLRDGDHLESWFWTILRRTIADLVVAERARRNRSHPIPDVPVETAPSLAACTCLRGVIDRLPEPHRGILHALDVEGQAPAEVATRLGIPTGTVAVRRHRARAALADALQRTCRTCAAHGCLDCTCREDHRIPESM